MRSIPLAFSRGVSTFNHMPSDFHNLPPLTPDQTNVVVAMTSVEGRLAEAALFAQLTLGTFLDLLESAEVQAHLDAAERATRRRARIRIADAAHVAVETLAHIAADEQNDKTERRRAATTLLRALTPRLIKPQSTPKDPTVARIARAMRSIQAETSTDESPESGTRVQTKGEGHGVPPAERCSITQAGEFAPQSIASRTTFPRLSSPHRVSGETPAPTGIIPAARPP